MLTLRFSLMEPKTGINQWQWTPFYFGFDFSPFCVPSFLVAESRLHLASLTFPELQRADSKGCYQGS